MFEIPDEVKNAVKYDESSPSKLVWNDVRLCGKGDRLTVVGEPAGWKGDRYYKVEIGGISYSAHRILYEILNGEIPEGYVIDHENKDNFDNSPLNLIAKPQLYNIRNQRKRKNNTSGITGVNLDKGKCGCDYWIAKWNDPFLFKQLVKRFSIKKLGFDEAFTQACQYRKEKIESMLQYGYSKDHGK